MHIDSEIRGPGLLGPHATAEYRLLRAGQPLILTREPTNPHDPNAVIAKTVWLQPCGYVAKEHAARIAHMMDEGVLWTCTVTHGTNAFHKPKIELVCGVNRRVLKDRLIAHGCPERTAELVCEGKFMKPDGETS